MSESLSHAPGNNWRARLNPNLKGTLKHVPGVETISQWAWHRKLARDWRKARDPGAVEAQVASYLTHADPPRLQVGAGPYPLDGWLNVDFDPSSPTVVFLDATKPFPLPDSTFTHIFSEHMIEHVPYAAGLHMLRECHRVLRPGGRIRVATPDLMRLLHLFKEPKTEAQVRYMDRAIDEYFAEPRVHNECFLLNGFLHEWGHQFVYDAPTLILTLEIAGFQRITRYPIGVSDDPDLVGLEKHACDHGEEMNAFETMVFEASKPH